MSQKFIIEGGVSLSGSVKISGSKNAALPIIAACLLTTETCVLKNVPDIGDIHTFLQILESVNVKTSFQKNTLKINAQNLKVKQIPHEYVKRLRASILLLAPILAKKKEAKLSFPGGCVLGKRPIEPHLEGFERLGAKTLTANRSLHVKAKQFVGSEILLSEMSVTATENILMAAVLAQGKTKIKLAAFEPHVQDLGRFLNKMGAKIKGLGTPFLEIDGVDKLHGTSYKITSDYLEAGTVAIAAALTKGDVRITNMHPEHLDSFWQKFKEIGVNFTIGKTEVHIFPPSKKYQAVKKLQTGIFPAFPTDLQAPLAVLLSQAKGVSKIFETLFEGRLSYLFELEKLGANIEILNPHQAIIIGPNKLKGTIISSCDIRAGAAMVLAALVAKGKTEIADINYTDRGYERLDEKLRKLGARIERVG